MVSPGQGLLLKTAFADGSECSYARTFLVIENSDNKLKALNVSSIKGKESKLIYPSNMRILKGRPPFVKPSFVKLDAIYIFEQCPEIERALLHSGQCINHDQFVAIFSSFSIYGLDNKVDGVAHTARELINLNPVLSNLKTTM